MKTLLIIWIALLLFNIYFFYKDLKKVRKYFELPDNSMWIDWYHSFCKKHKDDMQLIKTVVITWASVFYLYVVPLYALINVLFLVIKVIVIFKRKNDKNKFPSFQNVEVNIENAGTLTGNKK